MQHDQNKQKIIVHSHAEIRDGADATPITLETNSKFTFTTVRGRGAAVALPELVRAVFHFVFLHLLRRPRH